MIVFYVFALSLLIRLFRVDLRLSLSVLVATTTLAMGVNLPARLVIIKGTNHYRGTKGYQELPRSATQSPVVLSRQRLRSLFTIVHLRASVCSRC